MKKVFVTGAAGFIGYHLCEALIRKNIPVLGIDNFNDYYSVALKKERAQNLAQKNCLVEHIDLCDAQKLKLAIETFQPTHVVNLAAQAGVRYSLKNPHAYIQSNILGFTYLLEVLKDHPHIKTLYASSSSVYGDNSKIPYSETDITDNPKNLYGATKKANELMAYAYHSLYGMSLIGMRFFTVYGPWGRPDMAYYLFSEAILNNRPIDVFEGQGIQRDFTYIDDIIHGILSALDYEKTFDVFNFGNNNPVLLSDFISTLEEALERKAIRNYLPQAKGDMQVTFADISRSQKLLGYTPKTDLQTGLKSFADWFVRYSEVKLSRQ